MFAVCEVSSDDCRMSVTEEIMFALGGVSVCRVYSGRFAAGDKVTYNGAELLCHWCVVAASGAPERPTHVSPVQSVAARPQEIPVGDQLHSPDSDFSTSGRHCGCCRMLSVVWLESPPLLQ